MGRAIALPEVGAKRDRAHALSDFDVRRPFSGTNDEAGVAEVAGYCLTAGLLAQRAEFLAGGLGKPVRPERPCFQDPGSLREPA